MAKTRNLKQLFGWSDAYRTIYTEYMLTVPNTCRSLYFSHKIIALLRLNTIVKTNGSKQGTKLDLITAQPGRVSKVENKKIKVKPFPIICVIKNVIAT